MLSFFFILIIIANFAAQNPIHMPTLNFELYQLADLPTCAAAILAQCQPKCKFLLFGQMGAGKTTLIKAFCQLLGVRDSSHSPTYTLVNTYLTAANAEIYHIDLYRIQKMDASEYANIENYLFDANYCFIEWADILQDYQLPDVVKIYLEADLSEKRSLKIVF